jgi:hypothetical protein
MNTPPLELLVVNEVGTLTTQQVDGCLVVMGDTWTLRGQIQQMCEALGAKAISHMDQQTWTVTGGRMPIRIFHTTDNFWGQPVDILEYDEDEDWGDEQDEDTPNQGDVETFAPIPMQHALVPISCTAIQPHHTPWTYERPIFLKGDQVWVDNGHVRGRGFVRQVQGTGLVVLMLTGVAVQIDRKYVFELNSVDNPKKHLERRSQASQYTHTQAQDTTQNQAESVRPKALKTARSMGDSAPRQQQMRMF